MDWDQESNQTGTAAALSSRTHTERRVPKGVSKGWVSGLLRTRARKPDVWVPPLGQNQNPVDVRVFARLYSTKTVCCNLEKEI